MTTELDLGTDEAGRPVTKLAVNLNLGSGLSNAVGVEPVELGAFDKAYIAAHVEVKEVRFQYEEDEQGHIECTRVLVLKPIGATFVDEKTVKAAIQRNVDRQAEAEALRTSGQLSINFDDGEEPPAPGENATRDREKHPDLAKAVDDALAPKKPVRKAAKKTAKTTKKKATE